MLSLLILHRNMGKNRCQVSVLRWVCNSLWIFFTGMKSRPNKSVFMKLRTDTHTPETKGPEEPTTPDSAGGSLIFSALFHSVSFLL